MRQEIQKLVGQAVAWFAKESGADLDMQNFSVSLPPQPDMGDYATNAAFVISKKVGKPLPEVAEALRAKLDDIPEAKKVIEATTITNGFLNFKLSRKFLESQFLKEALGKTTKSPRKRETVLVEYSAPNIGKPLSIAHIRSTVIGDAIARIYDVLGYNVVTDNHLGDWGLQAGVLIAAYKKWGTKLAIQYSLEEALALYVRYNAEMKENPELREQAKEATRQLQNEDSKTLKLWEIFLKKSIQEYKKQYKALGIRKFDYVLGESTYRAMLTKVVSEALRRGVAVKSEGAVIIPVEGKAPIIIQKGDGGYLYGTFDLATIKYRMKRFKPSRMVYVVSNEQALYFEQVFKAAEKLGWLKTGQAVHVKFGLVRGEDLKRLSTRQGKIILLEDVVVEAVRRAREIVEKKNSKLSAREKEKIARMVGIGALKYNDLSQNRNTDIIFDWDKMLDLQGNSAPYLQYTYARLRSIARKAAGRKARGSAGLKFLTNAEEIALMKKVLQFPEAVEDAAKEYFPNLLCNYLWELANLANTFYEKYPVLKAKKNIREARLVLIEGVSRTIRAGLELLGIEAPERV